MFDSLKDEKRVEHYLPVSKRSAVIVSTAHVRMRERTGERVFAAERLRVKTAFKDRDDSRTMRGAESNSTGGGSFETCVSVLLGE